LPVVGFANVGYAQNHYKWNDHSGAAQQVEGGFAHTPPTDLTYTDGPLHRYSLLARIRQALGDQAGTLAALQLAKHTARHTGIALDLEQAAALDALMHLRIGQPEVAYQWMQGYARSLTKAEWLTYLHEFETLVFVRILLAQARTDEALALLAPWLPEAEATQRLGSVLEICLLQALALRMGGQTEAATHTLARALALAEPEGYLRLFVDEGEPMRMQIAEFGMRNPEPRMRAYVDKIIAAFANQPPPSSAGEDSIAPKSQIPNLVEPFTDRELEVLRLITAGLSNAAIAGQLVVSVGTIKTHLKHIYGKLAVQSRTQAVAQARAMGLL
jgi:LuxR family maltose regulon positive regulatory protein